MKHTQCLIVGAGPAGLSAAIYTARAGVDTLALGCNPKVAGDYDIDNYFGFPETVTGRELIERGMAQAKRFGATLRCERVMAVHHGENGNFVVKSDTDEYAADAVIIAAGVARVRPGIANLADYEGKGVSYCVSCDGFFYRGKSVLVLGEGDYAANQALELTTFTPQVAIYTQGKAPVISEGFAARLSQAGIPVIEQTVATLAGEPALAAARLANGTELPVDGIFIAMGQASALDFAKTLGLPLRGAFIQADHDQKTALPGVFAAGDCVGRFLQISVAVGEGAKAGKSAIAYLKQAGAAHTKTS
ncbi:NAD(P)/FAD-dependent oxidoreductase [Desulfolutivibrio sulfoxidireducens]|uniref:NAD(P)/FAD-dependent oxidoreductase n=1 Tax=Desulfolutivibrio sulfoxidireducens TaxID=2773299 RepID=UPI00159D8C4E|nr:NAD(P)/FAD-dependent oxidoreductase [Desulfolutivibrio sulfoxidireducens]QLA15989.1 NAD(P)/FAD-dependent oxidoreductase [Desulfolutivibrio sulfoxidireducens]QLA20103.1 NAD(P)/FAD-dependent oxidoreductase [Desulfolutivibrio sulfoxidireducens]